MCCSIVMRIIKLDKNVFIQNQHIFSKVSQMRKFSLLYSYHKVYGIEIKNRLCIVLHGDKYEREYELSWKQLLSSSYDVHTYVTSRTPVAQKLASRLPIHRWCRPSSPQNVKPKRLPAGYGPIPFLAPICNDLGRPTSLPEG